VVSLKRRVIAEEPALAVAASGAVADSVVAAEVAAVVVGDRDGSCWVG
jgi:hypothetical protein